MTKKQSNAYLLMGSNIHPERILPLAVKLLNDMASVIQKSSVWETPAVGTSGPNFLNAAVLATTEAHPDTFKYQFLRPLEARLGRVRTLDKNAPRTIDIDIVLWDDRVMDEEIWAQAHKAIPLAEIVPQLPSPMGETLAEVARRFKATSIAIRRLDVLF